MPNISTGCDRLLADVGRLRGRQYGLLAHGASLTGDGRPLHLALAASQARAPSALYGPEHGFYGVEQDMVASANMRDPWTGVPIVSLYGDDASSLTPRPEAFADLDLLLIDLQDVGSRYYTYAATAVWAARAALDAGLEVWVLDRPNPLGGSVIEGNRLAEGFESFVGAFAGLPVRHGLTLGELVRLHLDRDPGGLGIWAMEGWRREMSWTDTGLFWVAPSPNIPTLRTALLYPGGCLVEATELSEGRGTTRPFQLIGAPGVDPPALAERLEEARERLAGGLAGVRFLPTFFKPQFQKHGGEVCGGVEILVSAEGPSQPYRVGIEILAAFSEHLGDAFAWRRAPYEFVADLPTIDLLTGGEDCRRTIESGAGLVDWIASWTADEESFREERRPILLYPED